MAAERKKQGKLLRESEYNPNDEERADWRRVTRTHLGKLTGRVELHFNDGEPLTVRVVEVVKESNNVRA
jgi:hypothetical protein